MRASLINRTSAVIAALMLLAFLMPQGAFAQVPLVGDPGDCPELSRSLSTGMRGSDVVALQNFLIARDYLGAGNNTGYFGSLTQAAVIRFQSSHGVSPIGIVGPATRAAILQVCGGLSVGGGGVSGSGVSGVSMSASPTSGNVPLNVVFTINASAGYCGNYSLDFGDGAVEDMRNFCGSRTLSHTYNGEGSRTARLERVAGSSRSPVASVTVTTGAGAVSTPTCTMTLSKNTIVRGATTTLSWTSNGATKATWDDGADTGTSGSRELRDLATTTTKSITFRGNGGTKKCSVTVTVTAPPSGTVTVTGNATANGSVAELPEGGQSAFKLAEFQLKTSAQEAVKMKKLVFTLRNQTSDRAPGAAKVSNYRVTIGTASYPVSVAASGVYETGTVDLGSGISIAASQTLGVAIFADVVPNSGGHLDLWIYPADTQLVGATSGATITPTSQVTNRVDSDLLYWSGWIAVHVPTANTDSGGDVSGACVLDGTGYSIDPNAQCTQSRTGAATPPTNGDSCSNVTSGGLMCTVNGWVGNAVYNHTGVKVACMSKNGLFIPAGHPVKGNSCDENANDYPNCEHFYICRSNGWWDADSYGNWTQKRSTAPWIPDYWDTPVTQMNISY